MSINIGPVFRAGRLKMDEGRVKKALPSSKEEEFKGSDDPSEKVEYSARKLGEHPTLDVTT